MTRTLIVAPAWIGDMVMAQSLVARLKADEPDSAVDLIAPPWTAPLGERMPGVRASLVMDSAHGRLDIAERFRLGRSLRGQYDRAIVLPRSLKSALIPFFAGIPKRRGYVGEMRYGVLTEALKLDKTRLPRTIDQFCALASPYLAPAPDARPILTADPAQAQALVARLALPQGRVVALCPGAEYGPAKQWPLDHFAALGRDLADEGVSAWIFGSPKEREACETLAAAIGPTAHSLAGHTALLESLDLLSLAEGVISNDSGLMHVASALGRPVVGIYGSTSPGVTPPLGARTVVAERDEPCRPCFERTCPLGHLHCLTRITPDEIRQRLGEATNLPV